MSEQNVMEAPAHVASDDFEGGDFGNGDFDGGDNEGSNGGGQTAPGMGQSKSSRRRRRKRKNKVATLSAEGTPVAAGDDAGASAAPQAFPAPVVMEGESLALASPQQQQPRKPNPNGQMNGQGQSQGQGGKRWKKKFRDRDRRPQRSENPGNDFRPEAGSNGSNGFNGGQAQGHYGFRQESRPDNFGNLNGGFRRKNKGGQQQGRKERSFVGPMDHSYREVNGNFADSPPSTIQMHGRRNGHRHHGDSQPLDYNMPRAVPIPEDAQTHIYFFIEDLFLIAKIQETARKQGIKIAFLKNEKEAIAELTSGEDTNKPALIVFDLNNANAKPLTLVPKLRTKLKRTVSIIGFLSSIQGDLKAKAMEAGCDTVMPRAAFSQNLPNLLRRYGVEEEDEVNYNH